ncbi:hypothetical protein M413DRAFT_53029, partial [Hebeloma cylindrosporum]
IASESEEPRRSYSDVAASRPPSPTARTRGSTAAPVAVPVEHPIMDTSGSDGDERPWTTVERNRTRRSKVNKKLNNSIDETRNLAAEVKSAVQQAEKNLTHAQKEFISRRYEKLQDSHDHHERSESRGEGTSNPKGKQIDPREWGNIDLSDSE